MALALNNNHIIYYCMDAQWSVGLGWTYFASPVYLVVQCWVHSMFFFILILLIQQDHMFIAILSFLWLQWDRTPWAFHVLNSWLL